MPIVWLAAGVLLAAAELLTGDMFLLMLGAAALVTAGVGWATEIPLWAEGLVFALSAVVLVLGVRPALRSRLTSDVAYHTNAKALEGKSAIVVEPVDHSQGRVRLDGEVWTARSYDEMGRYELGESVTVVHIDGATAVVEKI
jgi:membrane protein implicated in regulation of membrane protease activity